MKKSVFAFCVFLATSVCSFAQNEGVNIAATSEKAETPEAVELLQMAGKLAKYGYSQQSALPLIQAAEIFQQYGGSDLDSSKTTEVDEVVDQIASDKKTDIVLDVNRLLADATNFADGDTNYLTLIEAVKNNATRGAVKNYPVHHDRVNARSTDTYNIRFRGGERACVIVSGDGDTDLDLYVYDENGNLITQDTDSSDDCVCVWNPRWTGNFTIKIKNLGRVYNNYSMAVN